MINEIDILRKVMHKQKQAQKQAVAKKRGSYVREPKITDEPTLLSKILSDIPFSEKVEAVRAVNPYFYLLTPRPQKLVSVQERGNHVVEDKLENIHTTRKASNGL